MNNPKHILITGTSKGIGFQLVKHYLKAGHWVTGCSRSTSTIEHERYHHFTCDVANEKEVLDLFFQIKKLKRPVEVLLNNAGIASMNHIITTPLSSLEKIFRTNVSGTFLFTREAAKMMMRNQKGRIVNFTSVASALFLEGESAYAASKAAVENLTVVSSRELAPSGITVNAIGFTPFDTDLIKSVPNKKMEELINMQSIKRKATIDDIINAVDFFISDKSAFITGQIIYLGGINA